MSMLSVGDESFVLVHELPAHQHLLQRVLINVVPNRAPETYLKVTIGGHISHDPYDFYVAMLGYIDPDTWAASKAAITRQWRENPEEVQ